MKPKYTLRNKIIYNKDTIIGIIGYHIFNALDICINKDNNYIYDLLKEIEVVIYKYYDWIKLVSIYSINISTICNILENKIYEFNNQLQNKNSKINNIKNKDKCIKILEDLIYYEQNFYCIISKNPCEKCICFTEKKLQYKTIICG